MKKILLVIIISTATAPALVLAQAGRGNCLYNTPFQGFSPWIGGDYFIYILIFILIGLLIFYIFKNNRENNPTAKNAIDILKERYAKGEITKKDFEDIKSDIK